MTIFAVPRGMRALGLAAILVVGLGAVSPTFAESNAAAMRGPVQDFSGLADRLIPAVVNITVEGVGGRGGAKGSGFVVSYKGYIVTNNHVVENSSSIVVQFDDGTELPARLVATDKPTDIAVIKVTADHKLAFVPFGDSDEAKIGNWVIAIGNPFGFGGTVTMGIISARNRELQGPYDDFIQTDAAINSGNSGGPLFNMAGEVIGVNTAIVSPSGGSSGIGLAIPSSLVSTTVKDLIAHGEVRRGWIGVNLQPVNKLVADREGLTKPTGVLISRVEPGGPADVAGIRNGDIILKFDGHDIDTLRSLPKAVAVTPVGKKVAVVVWRGRQRLTLSLQVGSLKTHQRISWLGEPDKALAGALGARLAELDQDLRDEFHIADGVNGVLVVSVDPDSPVAGRVFEGDVIVGVERGAVTGLRDMAAKLKLMGDPKAVLMSIVRDGELTYEALPVDADALEE